MNRGIILSHIKKSTASSARSSRLFLWISVVLGGAAVVSHAHYGFLPNYSWLFISPLYSSNNNLGWIISTWSAVLSIHGTIAALAITFMSMFISQVSEASEKDFVSICRQLVLREYKFYQFSVDAVCGLLIGVFFLVIGGGLIHYSLSMACSIFFIYQYMNVFKDLYFITEKKELIEDILLRKIRAISSFVNDQNENAARLRSEFEICITDYPKIISANAHTLQSHDVYKISPSYKENDKLIIGFDKKKINKLSVHLCAKFPDQDVKLYISPVFLKANFQSDAYLMCNQDIGVDENNIIRGLILDCFDFATVSEDIYFYTEVIKKIQTSTLNALLTNNETQMNFNVNALALLMLNSKNADAFHHLDDYINSMPSSKRISIESMAFFYKKIIGSLQSESNEYSNIVFESMFSLPMAIYNKATYVEYVNKIDPYARQKVQYDSEGLFLTTYIESTLKNLLHLNLYAFKINTEFLAQEDKYFDYSYDDVIKKEPEYYVEAMKSALTYLHVLTDIMLDENANSSSLSEHEENMQITEVIEIFKAWLTPSFLNDLYFNRTIYSILFKRHAKFSNRHFNFNNQSFGTQIIIPSNLRYHEGAILALLLYSWKNINNNLDLYYVRVNEEFIITNDINTNFIDLIINFIESGKFKKIVLLIEGEVDAEGYDFDVRKEKLLTLFNEVKNKLANYYLGVIISMPYDKILMDNYYQGLKEMFTSKLARFLNYDDAIDMSRISCPMIKNVIIEKREIIPSLNDTTYAMNFSRHASRFVNQIIDRLLRFFDKSNVKVVELESIEELPQKKFITINSISDGFSETYKFHRDNVRANEYGDLGCFTRNGFYYVCLGDAFEFKFVKDDLLKVKFMPLTKQFNASIDLDDSDLNLSLLARLKVLINMDYSLKPVAIAYFLSRENCLKDLKREEENMRLLHNESEINDLLQD